MGYYVRIVRSNAYIPKENLERAYEKMCALNVTHDHLKRGGSWRSGKAEPDVKWFSWMDSDYPLTCKNAHQVLEQLGFECDEDEKGNLLIVGYDHKTGQEDLFLESIKTEAYGTIEWIGEDGDRYFTEFVGDTVINEEQQMKKLTDQRRNAGEIVGLLTK